MQNGNSKNILVGFLITIILLLGVLLILTFNGTITFDNSSNDDTSVVNNSNNNSNKEEEQASYTYQDIEGLYGDVSSGEAENNYYIYLYEDGTFSYVIEDMSPWIYLGNYFIKDNKITLNYWVRLAGQYEENTTLDETAVITIDKEKDFTMHDPVSNENLTLKRITGAEEKNLVESKMFDISHLFNNLFDALIAG